MWYWTTFTAIDFKRKNRYRLFSWPISTYLCPSRTATVEEIFTCHHDLPSAIFRCLLDKRRYPVLVDSCVIFLWGHFLLIPAEQKTSQWYKPDVIINLDPSNQPDVITSFKRSNKANVIINVKASNKIDLFTFKIMSLFCCCYQDFHYFVLWPSLAKCIKEMFPGFCSKVFVSSIPELGSTDLDSLETGKQ